jgi:hypothetical protein
MILAPNPVFAGSILETSILIIISGRQAAKPVFRERTVQSWKGSNKGMDIGR